jgi:hypothetical protein
MLLNGPRGEAFKKHLKALNAFKCFFKKHLKALNAFKCF